MVWRLSSPSEKVTRTLDDLRFAWGTLCDLGKTWCRCAIPLAMPFTIDSLVLQSKCCLDDVGSTPKQHMMIHGNTYVLFL